MKIWFDTEFIEDGKTIDLISIGMVREDGKTFYLESADCDLTRASPWVRKNVLPHLRGRTVQAPRWRMAEAIKYFVGEKPEFWAYYASYDWVALCQLYGTMMDLPKGWPMFCRDVQQVRSERGLTEVPAQMSAEHNALADAIYTKEIYDWLSEVPAPRGVELNVRKYGIA